MMIRDKEIDSIANVKISREIDELGLFLDGSNIKWNSICSNAYSTSLENLDESYLEKLEKKYNGQIRLEGVYSCNNRIGLPLITTVLEDDDSKKHRCEFRTVDIQLLGDYSFDKEASFNADGDIQYKKQLKRKTKKAKYVSYVSKYNVLSHDFKILSSVLQRIGKTYQDDEFTVQLRNNMIIKKYCGIESIYDLDENTNIIKIEKKLNDVISISFKTRINSYGQLENSTLNLNFLNSEGSVIGTYKFSCDCNNKVSAVYYSINGNTIDYSNNIEWFDFAVSTIRESLYDTNIGNGIILAFINNICNNINNKIPNFDEYKSALNVLSDIENRIDEELKDITKEIPLTGLVHRLENYLKLRRTNNDELVQRKLNI